jgi:hypothetical protein
MTTFTKRTPLRMGVLALAFAAASCGGSGHHSKTHASTQAEATAQTTPTQTTATTPTSPSVDCLRAVDRKTRFVRFGAQGERLRAGVVGGGSVGVVLANQSDNTVCQWIPFPAYLAAHGMRVLAFNYGHGDASAEVQAAARFLRAQGVSHIVLIGASIGGAIVIDAGVHLPTTPAAVVSLSAVPEATTYPFPADARRLKSATFQIGATEDQLTQFGKDTRTLFHASPSPAKRLMLISGAAHGVDFVNAGAGNRVRGAILAFIRSHT